MTRIIVCGGRDFWDFIALKAALDRIHKETPITLLIHGNASGADRLSGSWAKINNVSVHPVPAQWAKFGKSAGPRRNQNMLGLKPDMIVAFPGGRGTADMVRRAFVAGVKVVHPPIDVPSETAGEQS
ncbi:DUF2493 domain-containing protein [Shinella sp. JR1-6]|uniref:DUF2493 domain-containing protein n=1 Tax=Shinella sp. JR1-6 TaxID=2527671 RepID=UPI00102D5166|nr:DUF2493 domain-containing protein [Shinella sp. JR1-6]TAA50919.1 DUF2493 domain-containing protein [Shinella sp. JR1-6]